MNAELSAPDPLFRGPVKELAVRSMFDTIAPRYDRLNRLLTFRLDVRWRRRTVRSLGLEPRSIVADLGCGTGDLCRDLHQTGYHVIGIDLSWGMLAASRSKVPLVQGNALSTPLPDHSLDGVTSGFALRNLEALHPFFVEISRILRSGGRIALLEVDHPTNPVLRFGHNLYFNRVVPWVGGLFSDRAAYDYLPRSVAYLPDQVELLTLIADAGFVDVTKYRLSGGVAQLLTATRR